MQCQVLDTGLGGLELLLVNLLFWRPWVFVDEINRQVKELAMLAIGQHILYGRDQPFRLQVATTQSERT